LRTPFLDLPARTAIVASIGPGCASRAYRFFNIKGYEPMSVNEMGIPDRMDILQRYRSLE
jgi:hypothetical protein